MGSNHLITLLKNVPISLVQLVVSETIKIALQGLKNSQLCKLVAALKSQIAIVGVAAFFFRWGHR